MFQKQSCIFGHPERQYSGGSDPELFNTDAKSCGRSATGFEGVFLGFYIYISQKILDLQVGLGLFENGPK